jgi:hypothetical protein
MLCAAIVENRDIDLEKVMNNHVPFLPKSTNYFLFTSLELKDKYQNILNKFDINYTIHDVVLDDDTTHGYNLLLTDYGLEFWGNFINYDRVLIFQSDSGLLKDGIEKFLEYDYIGAPYPQFPYVGNGGLSLRNPKIMHYICANYQWGRDCGEDLYFTRTMVNTNIGKLAPIEIASQFSVESIFKLNTLGYHKPWYYLGEDKWNQIKTQYK